MSCCLDVRSAADEQADKTALMLVVLRLADLDYATPELGAAAE